MYSKNAITFKEMCYFFDQKKVSEAYLIKRKAQLKKRI